LCTPPGEQFWLEPLQFRLFLAVLGKKLSSLLKHQILSEINQLQLKRIGLKYLLSWNQI
jgi:hypothetical protein